MSSFYDDDAEPAPVSRAEFDQLRQQLQSLKVAKAADSVVDQSQLAADIAAASSPEEVRAIVSEANLRHAEALHGAEALEGVDV